MAGLFNQMKDLYKLQKAPREMQKKMHGVKVVGVSDDEKVKVSMDGTQEIEEIEINDELLSIDNKRWLIKGMKEALKDAQKRLQRELAKDMDLNKIKGMLGA